MLVRDHYAKNRIDADYIDQLFADHADGKR